MPFQALIPWGWGDFYEKQIAPDERGSLIAGRVIAVYKYAYTLAVTDGPVAAVLSGRLRPEDGHADEDQLPVVGDWVLAKPPASGPAVIVRRLERRSALARRRPLDRSSQKTSSQLQVLAANLNYVFVTMSLNQDLNLARLERSLALIWNSGATPVVLLSKADLCPEAAEKAAEVETRAAGANVHVISSLRHQGLDAVLEYLKPGITGCLIGSSGAGKSTLINTLCGTELKTMTVREDDDKGRHATTTRALYQIPQAGLLIDTPGIREIGLLDDTELASTFSEIAAWSEGCKFSDCTHTVEPGCKVLEALAAGELPEDRYQNYLKLRKELAYEASKHDIGQQLKLKSRQKQLGKVIKAYFKNS